MTAPPSAAGRRGEPALGGTAELENAALLLKKGFQHERACLHRLRRRRPNLTPADTRAGNADLCCPNIAIAYREPFYESVPWNQNTNSWCEDGWHRQQQPVK